MHPVTDIMAPTQAPKHNQLNSPQRRYLEGHVESRLENCIFDGGWATEVAEECNLVGPKTDHKLVGQYVRRNAATANADCYCPTDRIVQNQVLVTPRTWTNGSVDYSCYDTPTDSTLPTILRADSKAPNCPLSPLQAAQVAYQSSRGFIRATIPHAARRRNRSSSSEHDQFGNRP